MWIRAKCLLCVLLASLIIVPSTQAVKQVEYPTIVIKKKHHRIKPIKRKLPKPKFGQRVVKYAKRFLGVPYRWGGESPSGFDCSGFVRFVYKHFGIYLPHNAYAQSRYGNYVAPENLMKGDLLFYHGYGHVGIYIGNGRIIHSPSTGRYVEIANNRPYFVARRIK